MPNLLSSTHISHDYVEKQLGKLVKPKLAAPTRITPREYEDTYLGQDDLFTIIKLVDKKQRDTTAFASFEDVSLDEKVFSQVQLSRSMYKR